MGDDNKNELKKQFEVAIKNNDEASAMSVLRQVFINAIELKINTKIIKGAEEKIETTINLLAGDITTEIHENFVPDRLEAAKFHQEQVNKAEQIIANNVETLKNLTKSVIELFV
jgi:hypothetical protein